MRDTDFPVVKDIVLLGGGHAHVAVLRRFGMQPINGARVTLISPEVDTPYSGMLPGLIAGHYTFDEAHIDLGPLARFADARYLATAAVRIDPDERMVFCADGRPPVRYDVLSVNTGSTPVFNEAVAIEREVIPVKPVSGFLGAWASLKAGVMEEPERRIAIVGGGAGGVELLLSMQFAMAREAGRDIDAGPGRFHLFMRDDEILPTHGPGVRTAMRGALASRGVTVHTDFDVTRVDEAGVSDGARTIGCDDVVWVTGAEPPAWFSTCGLVTDDRGFLGINSRLQAIGYPEIFGAGDAVTLVDDPRPKSGVFAVRQGPVLAENLRASVLGRDLKSYRPQKAFLSLISTGDKHAVASYGGWSWTGDWIWRWKDWIDRRFMARFHDLPPMNERPITIPRVADMPREVATSLEPGAMRCGGCGAKIGADTLARALATVGVGLENGTDMEVAGHEILLGAGDDAAAFRVPDGQVLVQTVDHFPAMIDDPFVFGQIAANHCLGDIFAMGAQPHSALVNVSMPFAAREKREADLVQLLAGVKKVLGAAQCRIIGGHTSESRDLALGLTVNGLAGADGLARTSQLDEDMALVLTKPIGSGAIFAAHGQRKIKGRWVNMAVAEALRSNAGAADIIAAHGGMAMTDVTGFGLAGHLGTMLVASGVDAEIDLGDIPLMEGAEAAVGAGVVSSLHSENLSRAADIDAPATVCAEPVYQLLFDPQTAGGLLAGIRPREAKAAVEALRSAGYEKACVIGMTRPRDGRGR